LLLQQVANQAAEQADLLTQRFMLGREVDLSRFIFRPFSGSIAQHGSAAHSRR